VTCFSFKIAAPGIKVKIFGFGFGVKDVDRGFTTRGLGCCGLVSINVIKTR